MLEKSFPENCWDKGQSRISVTKRILLRWWPRGHVEIPLFPAFFPAPRHFPFTGRPLMRCKTSKSLEHFLYFAESFPLPSVCRVFGRHAILLSCDHRDICPSAYRTTGVRRTRSLLRSVYFACPQR